MDSPEKIVIEFACAGLLERSDGATLGVYAGHDVLDRAVFTGGVHALQNDKQRVLVFRIEQIVQRRKLLDVLGLKLFRVAFVDAIRFIGREFLQFEFRARFSLKLVYIHLL